MMLSNKVYDVLKYIVLIVLPALATLYTAVSGLWNLPFAAEVNGTISAIDTCLGAMICVSTATYNKNGGGLNG